jgi:hypothetical protein
LGDLDDVGLTAPPQLNEVLTYDGAKWTTRSLSSIPIASGTPPPGGFKGVFWQDSAGDLSADQVFTYNSATYIVSALGISVSSINGRTIASDFSKLDGIQAGAEVNVNADWNASIGDAAILNKPTLAAVATSGAYADLTGIPSLVASVGATAPITSTGGTTPTIAINAATTSAAGTLTLVAGANITLTANAGTDAVTIAATGSTGVSSVTGTAPIVSSGGANPAISITAATTSAAGSMSASDKTKLDGIAAGAEVNQNAFSNIAVSGQGTIAADSKTDTLTFIAGSNVTITTNTTNDEITINASGGGGSSFSAVRTQSGTSYTLALTDAGAYIQTTSTTAVAISIPLQSSVAWERDTEIYFEQNGTGQITISGVSGVTLNTSETGKSFARYSVLALKRVAENVWTLTGERALV